MRLFSLVKDVLLACEENGNTPDARGSYHYGRSYSTDPDDKWIVLYNINSHALAR